MAARHSRRWRRHHGQRYCHAPHWIAAIICTSSISMPGKTAALGRKGRAPPASPAEATDASDFVILSLNHADIVRAGGVRRRRRGQRRRHPDKLLIDMSSIDPAATADMAARLKAKTGMAWVDCPLVGWRSRRARRQTHGSWQVARPRFRTRPRGDEASCGQLYSDGRIGCRADDQADQPAVLCACVPGGRRGRETGRSRRRRSGRFRRPLRVAGPTEASCRSSWRSSRPAISRRPAASTTC